MDASVAAVFETVLGNYRKMWLFRAFRADPALKLDHQHLMSAYDRYSDFNKLVAVVKSNEMQFLGIVCITAVIHHLQIKNEWIWRPAVASEAAAMIHVHPAQWCTSMPFNASLDVRLQHCDACNFCFAVVTLILDRNWQHTMIRAAYMANNWSCREKWKWLQNVFLKLRWIPFSF